MIDGHALLFRSYFAFATRPMTNSKGVQTSAIYGFCKTLFELLLKEQPTHLLVAFDPSGKNFRHQMYPLYKANRPPTPLEIKEALPAVKTLLEACNIPVVIKEGVEADDVIGTLSKKAEQEGFEVFMVTPDKDYGQLVSQQIKMYKPHSHNEGWDILGSKEICEKYGITNPLQVIDILAIWGDSSDNVPGVVGIGEVGAKKLVGQYGTVENILQHVHDLTPKMQERFAQAKEQLPLSKDLVTIRTHLDIAWEEDAYRVSCPNMEPLTEQLKYFEFQSLLRMLPRLESLFCKEVVPCKPSSLTVTWPAITQYTWITNAQTTNDLLIKAKKAGSVGLCAGEDMLAVYVPPEGYFFVARGALRWRLLQPLLEDERIDKCGFRLKELHTEMMAQSLTLRGQLFDPSLMHYLIASEQSHRMEDLAFEFLNYAPAPADASPQQSLSLFDVPGERILSDAEKLHPLFEEARIAYRLATPLLSRLEKEGMKDLYLQMEMPLMEVLASMEYEGIRIDSHIIAEYGKQLQKEALEIEQQIRDYAQEPLLNISSPKQLGDVLFEKMQIDPKAKKGKRQYSTDEETLSALLDRHPIVPLILEYRSIKKLLSSYIDSLQALADPATGRIHTTFNQYVTATGRLSSQKPNLQNIPIREERGKEIRKAFVPADSDHLLFSADYSQIELRLMAHMSQDPDFIAAFNANEDIHTATAAKIFHCSTDQVSAQQRSRAKVANFGILYGISAFGLSGRLKIPRAEAKQLIDDYFSHYPTVKNYLDSIIQTAQEKGYVETLFHRKRMIPDIHSSNATIRSLAQRNAINAPIQGTAADIIKIAMIQIYNAFQQEHLKSRMLLQVHDELVFDVYLPEKDKVKQIVNHLMENAVSLSVPLSVGTGFGNNWLEAH